VTRAFRVFAALGALGMAILTAGPALAQKQGGTLRIYHRDSPASMSIHEEGTVGVIISICVSVGSCRSACRAGSDSVPRSLRAVPAAAPPSSA